MKLKLIKDALVQPKYLEALSNLVTAFADNKEVQVAELIEKALLFLRKSPKLTFSELIALNEEQITAQLNSLHPEHRDAMTNSLNLERMDVLKKLLLQPTKNVVKATAIVRALEQTLEDE